MVSSGLRCSCFFITIFQILSIAANVAAILVYNWISLGSWEGSLLQCENACGSETSYSDLKTTLCDLSNIDSSYDDICTTYKDLYIGGLFYIVGACVSMFCTLVWLILTCVVFFKGKSLSCGIFFGFLAFAVQAGVYIAYMIFTQTMFTGCDSTDPSNRRPNFCAKVGPSIAIADAGLLLIVFVLFICFGVKVSRARKSAVTANHDRSFTNMSAADLNNSGFKVVNKD